MDKVVVAVSFASDFFLHSEPSSGSDETDTDEVIQLLIWKKKRCKRRPVRLRNYVEEVVPAYNAVEFQSHFRVTVEAYEALMQVIGPKLKRKNHVGRNTIDIEKQVLATLWLLATPDSYRSVGERFDLGKSSLSVCLMRVIKVLNEIAHRIIYWPRGDKLEEIQRRFYEIARVDGVIGAVDGTFIAIKAPKEDPQSYVTRKCNFAITLQAIAEPSLKFTDIFVGFPGSVSDTRIFRNSPIYSKIRDSVLEYFPTNQFIIGDKAYPVLTWCLSPYIDRGNLTAAKSHFNTKIAQTRQVVERSFGLLFGRFRRLKYLDMNRTDLIPSAALAACVLHNLCLDYDDLLIEQYIEEGMEYVLHNDDNQERGLENNFEDGIHKRDAICRQLFTQRN